MHGTYVTGQRTGVRHPIGPGDSERAQDKKIVQVKLYNLRDWALDKHGTVDDRPYGGGPGMILRVEPIYQAIKDIKNKAKTKKIKTFLLSPQGKIFNQSLARELSNLEEILLICGHYEGFDERIRNFVDDEISIGDYILTGGEIPAMAITDAIVRLVPGVLKKPTATEEESFSPGLSKVNPRQKNWLEYPQYTRPKTFQGLKVPEVLLSGDHKKIKNWQKKHLKEKNDH